MLFNESNDQKMSAVRRHIKRCSRTIRNHNSDQRKQKTSRRT